MPVETRYYVPTLQALKNIVAQPELFGIRLPGVANQPYFETVVKPQRMDVAVAARLAEIPIEEFVSLNPAYHRPVMNSHQAGPLVLPADKVGTFLANLERYEAQDIPLSNWQTHQMKRGDTLEKVAAKYGIDTPRLKQINGITPRLKIGPGFNLLVPRPGGQANPDQIARALPKLAPEKAPAVKSVRGGKTAKGKAPTAAKAKTKAPAKPAAKKAAAKPQPKKKR
jgi:membrane-bound lytic murein transglycosylase D